MNRQVAKLFSIAQKESRTILGLMSGTSLDGLDLAVCKLSGSGSRTSLKLVRFKTLGYTASFRKSILRVFAQENIQQADLSGLNALIADTHAEMVLEALTSWGIQPEQIDLLASHGQTVYHAPLALSKSTLYPNNTLQIGDGDHLAVKTGIITLSDFRQKHIAAGGEGAPLALYGDYLLYSDTTENRILLNMGGIANFTFLPSKSAFTAGHTAFASDVGPANTMMNQYMQEQFGLEMDKNGEKASTGVVIPDLLDALMDHSFFQQKLPKTTGPELFNLHYLREAVKRSDIEQPNPADIMATLCAFSAHGIAKAVRETVQDIPAHSPIRILASGGGLSNPLLMKLIKESLKESNLGIESFDTLGLNPDAKEAALFAVLANESIAGSPEHVRGLFEAPAVCMGKISLPE